jgi:tetratricopeptide (TPR) repeat protein
MRSGYLYSLLLCCMCAPQAWNGQTLSAQCHSGPTRTSIIPEYVIRERIALRDGIGRIHEVVTTISPVAQMYYDQGLTFLYVYDWINAARSFYTALDHDPNLAMAHLGVSYAFSGLGDNEAAAVAERRAQLFAREITRREAARIELRKLQLEAMAADDQGQTDDAYIVALDKYLAADPSNVPLLLLRGNASEGTPWGRGQRGGALSSHYYEQVLKADALNPVAHHFLAHSYELMGDFASALKHARAFVNRAPSLPHAQHMYGHELLRAGKTQEAIGRFEKADLLTKAAFAAAPSTIVYDWHYRHNLNLLAAAYRQAGMRKQAEVVLTKLAALPVLSEADEIYKEQLTIFLLQQGRYSAIFDSGAMTYRPVHDVGHVLQHALKGSALAGSRNGAAANAELALAQTYFRKVSPAWRSVLQPWLDILQAQVEIEQSKLAVANIRLIHSAQDANRSFGTDSWSEALFQLPYIGEIASQAGLQDAAYVAAEQLDRIAPERKRQGKL